MKGNIIKEMRKVIKELYNEGHEEIFGFSIVSDSKNKDRVIIQVADFSLEPKELDKNYEKTYTQALKTMNLAKVRYGKSCKAINALISDEESENVWMDKDCILRVFNLNVEA